VTNEPRDIRRNRSAGADGGEDPVFFTPDGPDPAERGSLVRVDAPEVDALEAGDRLLYIRSADTER